MKESFLKKIADRRSLTLLKIVSNTGVFLWSLQKFWEHLFLQNTPGECFCTSGGCFCIFSKKYLAISQPCYDVLIKFSSRHIVWCRKSRTRFVHKFVVNCHFLNNSIRVYPIKLKIGMIDHMNNTFRKTVF